MVFAYWFLFGVLIFIATFGVGCAVNMFSKRWWLSLALGGAGAVWLLAVAGGRMVWPEWIVFAVGCAGAGLAAWAVYVLRKRGYPLFS
ncbi:hypothetical protein GCM10010885_19070 [Alicyclobacillus cellulosilyticus]|uniref:Uncharacterized protein n=1 Tax=Alicyclobacillus cellulosilyticus TaxID=1003997 RepID=A0A917KHI4_9BACL|nr:hypothetical protein [Alicyclobacillus cellulosilyticus]GGJ10098.1 hypothetical protein GCM10010885_19070 [Alicyclobacillus cellulosilyticus]